MRANARNPWVLVGLSHVLGHSRKCAGICRNFAVLWSICADVLKQRSDLTTEKAALVSSRLSFDKVDTRTVRFLG